MRIPQLPAEIWDMIEKFKKEGELKDKELCRKIYTPWNIKVFEDIPRFYRRTEGTEYSISYVVGFPKERNIFTMCAHCFDFHEVRIKSHGGGELGVNLYDGSRPNYKKIEWKVDELRLLKTYSSEWRCAHRLTCKH